MFDKRKDNTVSQAPPPAEPNPDNPPIGSLGNSRSAAVIGQTIKIKGSITGEENLTIEGTVEGSVDLPKHDVTIGQSGEVTADVNANTVRVDGKIEGDINGSEKVIVTKSGKVQGNIVAPRVTLEDGAKFKGSIDMDPGETVAKPTPVKPAATSDSGSSDVKAAG
jgi:cytoskeletal protein CcmA (bactofilin family)